MEQRATYKDCEIVLDDRTPVSYTHLGVFVPQAIMSPAVLKVSQFLPAYWYVRANDLLGSIHTASAETLRPVFECMGIQLLYAAALFALALLLSKKKQVTAS